MRIFIVGGYLRDQYLGITPQDKDYVVVGSSPQELQAKGFIPIGQDFPVFLHPKTKEEYALARTERKTGQGYKGFTFYASPEVTLEQDLLRRDFTMNAMAQEITTDGEIIGPLIDPFGGQRDMNEGVIRHVSDAFNEDPLRILRLARFMAKFIHFEIASSTLELVGQMVKAGELQFLVPERVWQEISRGLMEARPSRMIDVLVQTQASDTILPGGLEHESTLQQTKMCLDTGAQQGLDIQIQLAYLLAFIELSALDQWTQERKIPTDVKNFAHLFHQLHQENLRSPRRAQEVLNFFNQADAWRKPERLKKALLAEQVTGSDIQQWQTLLEAALAVDAGTIAKNMATSDGSKIQSAVAASRLQAIAACL